MDQHHPSREDPVVSSMSELVGGPVGDHAAGHRWWGSARALLGATSLVLAAGMVSKTACVPSAWAKDRQPFAELCWTDVAGVSADRSTPPWVTTYLVRFAGAFPGEGTVATAAVLAVLLAILALLVTALLVRVDPRRPWSAAGWAMAPVLVVHWLSWDLMAATGVAVLLWGWVTGRTWLAGVGAGIGAAFALPVAAALAGVLAVGGRTRDRVDALLAAAAAYVVVTLPGRARTEDPDTGSIWRFFERSGSMVPSSTVRIGVVLLVLALGAGAVLRLVSGTGRTDAVTVARAGLVMLGAALLVAPSAPPESSLLLLPLAAIGLRRWRDLLIWQGCELVSWAITGWYLGDALVPTVSDDARAYWIAILLRVVGLAWLVAAVLRAATAESRSGDDDVVEVSGGEAHADRDALPDTGHPRA
ncbi:MAG: hypothetical protein LH477_03250 [Nocardioides sp.]|nr:hypothetical protein [Nocardioides sp.]